MHTQGQLLLGEGRYDQDAVRARLREEYPRGPHRVTEDNFLTLDAHWEAVVRLLGATAGRDLQPDAYSILCVDWHDARGHNALNEGPGRTTLMMARENRNHFVPLARVSGPGPSLP